MGSTPDNTEAVALTDAMLEQKQAELKSAKKPHVLGAVVRTGTGAAAGFLAGVSAVVGGAVAFGVGIFKRVGPEKFQKLGEMTEEAQRAGKLTTPEIEKAMSELENTVVKELEHSNSFSASVIKHPGGWVGGLTAAGAGLGMLWQMKHKKQEVTAKEKEVNSLQRIKDSWQSQVTTQAEDKSCDAERTL